MDYNKNYYDILNITKDSSQEDIKKSYRNLAKKHHPDVSNKGDEKFKEISEAFEVLSDPKSKQEYDHRSPHGNSYSPFNSNPFEFHFGNDFFSSFFGGSNPFGDNFNPFDPFARQQPRENLDIYVNININLQQIYSNENLNIKYKKNVYCETCDEKVELKDTEITIQNLYQIRNNVKSVQRGYGHQSKIIKEKQGNLILSISVERNDDYEIVNNYELHKTINVHYQDAIDGVEILYSHIDNTNLKIKLPTKTKDGDIIRMKEKGLLKNDTNRDDLYLKINIIIDYERV